MTGILIGMALILSLIPLQQLWYWREDRAWKRFAATWAEAAHNGVDTWDLLKDCPDMNGFVRRNA